MNEIPTSKTQNIPLNKEMQEISKRILSRDP
jgi:hypothetical protein